MVEIVDESFTSRFIKIKEQREKNIKKVLEKNEKLRYNWNRMTIIW